MAYAAPATNSYFFFTMAAEKTTSLRTLNRQFSPDKNPLIEANAIEVKKRYVHASRGRDLVDPLTGELHSVAKVHTVAEKDDEEFVKVFAEGVKAMYGLKKGAFRVFQAILEEYQKTKMSGGYADSIYLNWFDGKLCGREIGMSERTFQNGFKELLLAGFLAPKSPNLYWVNPALFFKGNRVAFIREYRRAANPSQIVSEGASEGFGEEEQGELDV